MNLSTMLENMSRTVMLSKQVEDDLSNAITGFKVYWLNMIKDPSSWKFDMGARTSEEMAVSAFVEVLGKQKSFSDETIEAFSKAIDDILLENIEELLANIESVSAHDIIRFSVDYDPYHHLARAIKGIDELYGTMVFPCKTRSVISIKDVKLENNVIVSATIRATSMQGYCASNKLINIDGKLVEIEGV